MWHIVLFVILAFIVFWIAMYLAIVVHEFGHLIFRKIFGVPTQSVRIGTGPCICSVGCVQFRWFPLGGMNAPYTFCYPRVNRKKKIVIYGAGSAVNFIFSIVFSIISLGLPFPLNMIPFSMAICNFLLIFNLIPHRKGKSVSDGLMIIALLYNMEFLPPDHPCENEL
ncbi:site-2 protease family protein [Alicyclobacillus mali]|uniref:Site-2 protease family protein n=1 Tax=Alicyclobacillus mali (ex Roth et al. 2021) TaxID=1123961 RepID=A0ABS0EZA7_9BACL|nr:site-2 protease family protein [Alicyclobacillus mali (ex Roth et al. 2021)]MBF8376376.1 site-2 protease family protein [Alicyclobacillus mali (ex Roth et al. 2021)]